MVAAAALMSWTPSDLTTTTLGPGRSPGIQARPTKQPADASVGAA
jgi:hypothetical protein